MVFKLCQTPGRRAVCSPRSPGYSVPRAGFPLYFAVAGFHCLAVETMVLGKEAIKCVHPYTLEVYHFYESVFSPV